MKLVKIVNLFDIKYGNSFELINLTECEPENKNKVNYISRTEKNNGVSSYVKRNETEPFPGGTLTVAVGGSVLSTFLQIEPYYTGFHIMVLSPIKKMSKLELLFYCYCIRQNKYRYNYGRQANKSLKNILIPESMPREWETIEIDNLNTLKKEPLLNIKLDFKSENWKEFPLTDLFEISGSKTTSILDLEDYGTGPYPFVTTAATNNGVEGLYNHYTEDKNILTVDSAVIGYCSYQPLPFSASDHVEKLKPKFEIDKHIGLFLATIMNKEQYRYNYGRKASQTRLKQRSIKLPVKNDQPDWEFMRLFIKSLPYSANLLN
jgi:restriction endonuclease S subunit